MESWILVLLTISPIALGDILLYFPGEPRPLYTLKDMPSSFGDTLSFPGLQAKITYANPADGCELIDPPLDRNISHTWIALISRNNCSFELKIRNAQESNYNGVIVHNVGSDDLLEMHVENATGIEIPSVFIGENDGFYLRRTFALHNLYYVVIDPDLPFNYLYLFLLLTGIIIVLFFVGTLILVINYATHKYRQTKQIGLMPTIRKLVIEHTHVKGNPYEKLEVSSNINIPE